MTDGGTVVDDGIWSVHQRPRAVQVDDRTYVGSVTSDRRIAITEVNHSLDSRTTRMLGTVSVVDDHSSPSIYLRDDDRIVVFWADRDDNRDTIFWQVSDDPLDISSWGDVQSFAESDMADYPQPVQYNGDLRLFYRVGGSSDGTWKYRDSTDGGYSFGAAQDFVDFSDDGGRTYLHAYADGGRVDFAMGDYRESHPAIRHWYLEDGDYYESDGTHIQSGSGELTSLDSLTIVYDGEESGNNPPKQYDLIVDDEGHPHVAFTEHVETGSGGGDGDYRARWAQWDGQDWTVGSEIAEMGGALPITHYYESGLSLDSQDPTTVYVSVETERRNYQIQEWATNDGGETWTKVDDLSSADETLTSPTKRGRPISPRNHDGSLPALWWAGLYDDFDAYNTQVRREQS